MSMPLSPREGDRPPPAEPRPPRSAAEPSLTQLLRVASRTFAVGIERLPGRLRPAIETAYLLLRVSDYLEDNEEMEPRRKAELLRLWESSVAGEAPVGALLARLPAREPLTPDAQVAVRADRVLDSLWRLDLDLREPIAERVRQSTLGMARWAERGPRIETEAELDDYMHQVAGLVGYLLTDVFSAYSTAIARRHAELLELGREFGLGLQTVNVIRGLRDDYERGWIFVPESYARRHGIAREDLFRDEHREAAFAVVDDLAEKAERHLDAAAEYVKRIPRRHHAIRVFCLLLLFFAVRTLAASRGNPAVLHSGAKISRDEVRRIVRRTTLLGWSDRWIDHYVRALRA